MKNFARLLLLLSFILGMSRPGPTADSREVLRKDLDGIFSDLRFAEAQWGVMVYSLDRSEILYEKNARRLLVPASNNKILAAAVALLKLGPDYRFETRILAEGPIKNGLLEGNLIIRGSGDPTHSKLFLPDNPFAVFEGWAEKLKDFDIHSISGDIVGDTGAFDDAKYGKGWEWDDLIQGYAAPVSALQFNDNAVTVEILAGAGKGAPAVVRTSPLEDYLEIENSVVTEGNTAPVRILMKAGEDLESVVISGCVPSNGRINARTVAVQSPVRYYLSALKQVLCDRGVKAAACRVREQRDYETGAMSLLWTHLSAELSEILKPLLKESHNLFAETLARTLGLRFSGEGSFDKGKEVVEASLEEMGIPKGTYAYVDSSGLSRLNLLSADALVGILRHMHRHQHFRYFYDALPTAGIDGTLEFRLRGTKAENNVRAKTGSLANVSSISGYLQTDGGEMLAFSMIANHFLASRQTAENLQNRALLRLADLPK